MKDFGVSKLTEFVAGMDQAQSALNDLKKILAAPQRGPVSPSERPDADPARKEYSEFIDRTINELETRRNDTLHRSLKRISDIMGKSGE